MEAKIITTLLKKEINDSLNNRWFVLYAAAFTGLALLLSWLSLSGGGTGYSGFAGFGRTAASLINLVLLVVPLMALTIGAGSLAGERERGTLSYLLAQPINRAELLLGKYLGVAASLLGALALGFGLSAIIIAGRAGQADARAFSLLVAFAFALALGMLSLGFLISVLARKAAVATGVALFLWLGFVFGGDLGLMGTALAFKLPIDTLFNLALINPLQVFKMSALISLNSTLDVLGPAGTYAMQTYRDSLTGLFLGSLAAWIVVPLFVSYLIFSRAGGCMSIVQFLRWRAGRNSSQFSLILLLAVLLLALAACGGQASAEPAPPTIYYGEDICEFCGMIISEERYAAGYITADGQERIFDDLGDMVQSHLQKQEDVTAFFVHDRDSLKWIRAETAYYALADELPTPMLSGLAAFDSTEKAESFAAELGGEVLTFEELLAHYRENPPTPFFAGTVED